MRWATAPARRCSIRRNQLAQVRSRLFNAFNRLEQEIGGTSPASQITRFGYDNQGNLTGITDPLEST